VRLILWAKLVPGLQRRLDVLSLDHGPTITWPGGRCRSIGSATVIVNAYPLAVSAREPTQPQRGACGDIGDQRAPYLLAGEPVDRETVVVFQHHHCAARDVVWLAGTPQRLQLVRGMWIAPREPALRRRDRGRELSPRSALNARAEPRHRRVARLREQLL